MPFQDFDTPWPPITPWNGDRGIYVDTPLDGTFVKLAFCFQAPKNGVIDSIEFLLGSIVSAQDIKISLQNVDMTSTLTGRPDEVVDQFRVISSGSLSADTWTVPGVITSDGTNGGTKRTVAAGEFVAFVIEWDSTQGDLDLRCNDVVPWIDNSNETFGSPWFVRKTASWVNIGNVHGNFAIRYDDGSYGYLPPLFPSSSRTFVNTFNSASSPDERGIKFSLPVKTRIRGAWLQVEARNDNFDIVVYEDGEPTPIHTHSWDKDLSGNDDILSLWTCEFTPPLVLEANQVYRLVLKPTSASGSVDTFYHTLETAALREAWGVPFDWEYTERTDAGAWTDTPTQRFHGGIFIEAIDAIAPEVEFITKNALLGSIGDTWVEWDDKADTRHVWTGPGGPLPDPASYHEGFKQVRVSQWGSITRGLSDFMNQLQVMSFSWTAIDTDSFIRALADNPITRFMAGRMAVLYTILDADRRLLLTPRVIARGRISEDRPLPNFLYEFRAEGELFSNLGSNQDQEQIPKRRISQTHPDTGADIFTDCPPENLGKPEPIVLGRMSNFGGTPGASFSGVIAGLTATGVARSGTQVTGLSTSRVTGSSRFLGFEFPVFYRIGAIVGGLEGPLSVVVGTDTGDQKAIQVDWDAVGGAGGYTLYASHRSDFRQFRYKALGVVTTYTDDPVAANQDNDWLQRSGMVLGLRMNLKYRVYGRYPDGSFSEPMEVRIDAIDAGSSDVTSLTPHAGEARGSTIDVELEWDALADVSGYTIFGWRSFYTDWQAEWNFSVEVSAATTTYLHEITNIGESVEEVELPGGVANILSSGGKMPVINVGTEQVAGEKWTRLLVAGHACKDVQSVYHSVEDSVGAGLDNSAIQTDRTFRQVPDDEFGTAQNWLAPGQSGWPHPNDYVDIGGRRYTLILTKLDPAPAAVNVNVLGMEDVGDGSGTLIESIVDFLDHVAEQFVLQDYQTGLWLGDSVFSDDTSVTKIDKASVAASKAVAALRISGGYLGGGVIGLEGFASATQVLSDLAQSCDTRIGENRKAQLIVTMFSESAALGTTEHFDERDIREGFEIINVKAETFNVIPYEYQFNPVTGRFDRDGEIKSQESIDGYGFELVMPIRQLKFVQTAEAADDITQRILSRFRFTPRRGRLPTHIKGANVELGDIIRVSHPEGTGAAPGWVERACMVVQHSLNPQDLAAAVELGFEDVDELFMSRFIFGDETVIAATWGGATAADKRYGYLCDEATGQFGDGSIGKRV